MKASRCPYLEPLKDENGNPDPDRAMLLNIEYLGCYEICPVPPPPIFTRPLIAFNLPRITDNRMPLGSFGIVGI